LLPPQKIRRVRTSEIPSHLHERNSATDSRKRGIKRKSSLRVKSIIYDKAGFVDAAILEAR
jgi:hypothetical protein